MLTWRHAAVAAIVACGPSVQAGLSNAPAATRTYRPVNPHDVVSNGPESCATEPSGKDPLAYRTPPCPTERRADPVLDAGSALR